MSPRPMASSRDLDNLVSGSDEENELQIATLGNSREVSQLMREAKAANVLG